MADTQGGNLSSAFCRTPPSLRIGRSGSSPSPLRKGRGEAEGQCGRWERAAAVGRAGRALGGCSSSPQPPAPPWRRRRRARPSSRTGTAWSSKCGPSSPPTASWSSARAIAPTAIRWGGGGSHLGALSSAGLLLGPAAAGTGVGGGCRSRFPSSRREEEAGLARRETSALRAPARTPGGPPRAVGSALGEEGWKAGVAGMLLLATAPLGFRVCRSSPVSAPLKLSAVCHPLEAPVSGLKWGKDPNWRPW